MKILYAVHHFPPRYSGGAEWRAYRTAAAMQSRGHATCAVAVERIDAGPDLGLAWEEGVFEGVNVRRLSFNMGKAPDPERWEYDNPWIGDHLQGLFESWRPDVFHLIGGYLMTGSPLRAAQRMGIPTVLSLTDFWFLCKRISMLRSDGRVSALPVDPATCARCLAEDSRRYRLPGQYLPGIMELYWKAQTKRADLIQQRLDYLLETLNRVDAIISPSQFLHSFYVEAGVDPDRILFSRQGRDFPSLPKEETQRQASSLLRVGYIGQIAWHKGVHVLFEAVKNSPNLSLQVRAYGNESHFPDYAAHLRKIAAGDARLELAGVYERHQVSRVYREMDVLVVPSVWYENSPNVILEAFAHRVPVIATDLGGMAELVRHEQNGLLFPIGDSAGLASQLRRLVEEPGLLASLQDGIPAVRTESEEMDELVAIYTSVFEKVTPRSEVMEG